MVEGDSTWTIQVLPHQDFTHGAVQISDFDAIGASVCPINLAAQGVHGEAIGCHEPWGESFLSGSVHASWLGLFNFVGAKKG